MIVACLKWASHPGEPADERFAGMSPADGAALELALRQAEAMGDEVVAVTVGPAAAERVLREAHAAGARRLVRLDTAALPPGSLPSDAVAAAIAGVVRAAPGSPAGGQATWVWCGDYSLDRGSGSTPAFVAASLGARQALGCIAVEPHGHGTLRVVRRLDGGRREVLEVQSPAVVSVEGSVASLRRASLAAVRSAAAAPIEVHPGAIGVGGGGVGGGGGAATATGGTAATAGAIVRPYRPRARALAAPAGESTLGRLRALTDAAAAGAARGETVELAPADAAARIVRALDAWGYLRGSHH